MISIVEADQGQAELAQSKLLPMLPAAGDETTFLRNVKEGLFRQNVILAGTTPAFLVFWEPGFNRTFLVKGVSSLLDGTPRTEILNEGLDLLATMNGCQRITFHTFRSGMAAIAPEFGYKAHSVCFLKELP